ncbi:MAG: glycosyltransferase family 2 protein [Thermodesulfovibrionales bacterium]|nr:glycosyltransferase family 2 protein [Thermodesulfovibrionales bacterium]
MAFLIVFLKAYLVFLFILISLYIIRHFIFTYNRILSEQRVAYHDILDSDFPTVSILIPMHNEEKVAEDILKALINQEYPKEKMEIIPINDHSEDRTKEILERYAENYSFIKPLHRLGDEPRGKTVSLNDALRIAKGEIIVVYDADYLPLKGQIRELVINFIDPDVGAVMGRVIPINTPKNLLTRLLDMERSGGYQVDQQARFNLGLIPQYGGTVGAIRKALLIEMGGFDEKILAEDTEITFRLYINGYEVLYNNKAECYEESPESWQARAKQIRRWSRGHNQVLFKYFFPLWISKKLNFWQKIDGTLLLFVYAVPFLFMLGILDSIALFFLGEMEIFSVFWVFLALIAYNSFGNFASFFQIGLACFLDGVKERIRLLPFFYFIFLFNMWCTSLGALDALLDITARRKPNWDKTERFRGS